jgi:hypothetical protein
MCFSELEYAAKKTQTRRDRFLGNIEAVTPWPAQDPRPPSIPISFANSRFRIWLSWIHRHTSAV